MRIIGLSVFYSHNKQITTVCMLEESQKYIISNDSNVVQKVERFPPIHYRIKAYNSIGDVFDFSKGYLNMAYFKLDSRFKEIKRKVWIFVGDSVLGKTFLSDRISLTKYETDSSPELPENFTQEIIVIGNKYPFDVDQIVSRIYNREMVEVIVVNFNPYAQPSV